MDDANWKPVRPDQGSTFAPPTASSPLTSQTSAGSSGHASPATSTPAGRQRQPWSRQSKRALALVLAAAAGVGGALAIRAMQSDSTSSPGSAATPTTLAASAGGQQAASTAAATAGSAVAATSLPAYAVGQCLGLATTAGAVQPVVDCSTAKAFDLVTATAASASIACPPPEHGGPAMSHTVTFDGNAFSWCAAAPPTRDGFFQIGTCFQHIDSNGAVSFVERACDDSLATHRIIGEAALQDCSAVPGATATISKSKAEGAGYWCAQPLH